MVTFGTAFVTFAPALRALDLTPRLALGQRCLELSIQISQRGATGKHIVYSSNVSELYELLSPRIYLAEPDKQRIDFWMKIGGEP